MLGTSGTRTAQTWGVDILSWAFPSPASLHPVRRADTDTAPPSLFLTQNSPTPRLLNMGGVPGRCPQPSLGAWRGVSCWC